MTQVAIQLPDDLGTFVHQSVASGSFHSADEFFTCLVTSYREQVEAPLSPEDHTKLTSLRQDIQIGMDQFDRGEIVRNLDWDAFIAERHSARATALQRA